MPNNLKLKAEPRKISGRKVKQLRRQGIIPANIYGKDVKSLSIQIPAKEFKAVFAKAGETAILDLEIIKEAKPRPVLIHSVQQHPVTDEILHADFHQVDLTKKVVVAIPVEVSGIAPATTKGGVLIQLIHETEVEALPRDLPEKFMIDVSKLAEIGQGISLKDIKVDTAKVKIMSENLDELVVKIEEPTKEEVVAAPVVEAAVPAEGEAKPASGAEALAKEPKPGVKPEPKKEAAKPETKSEPKAEKK
ncbi:MAG: 50S ribosomal protein L25 [Candidatus Beckwithbacteria bacterium]|nr:50S ribosomal protein L25 [Candidatus Beckwithbacteria bacterium]